MWNLFQTMTPIIIYDCVRLCRHIYKVRTIYTLTASSLQGFNFILKYALRIKFAAKVTKILSTLMSYNLTNSI